MGNILETVVFAAGETTAPINAENTTTTTETTAPGASPAPNQQAGAGSQVMGIAMQILPFVLIIALLYFMMIRPQRKREKEAKAMINAMKVGDKVVTIGGICGKVAKIKDEFVFIETGNIGTQDEKSLIKMERDAIRTVEASKN